MELFCLKGNAMPIRTAGLVVSSDDPEDSRLRARNGTKMRIQGSDELVIDTNGESGREGCPAYHQARES